MIEQEDLPRTLSTWIGDMERAELVNDYDRVFGREALGDYTRSLQMIESMKTDLKIQHTLDDLGYGFDNPVQRREFVAQACREKASRERDQAISSVPGSSAE